MSDIWFMIFIPTAYNVLVFSLIIIATYNKYKKIKNTKCKINRLKLIKGEKIE